MACDKTESGILNSFDFKDRKGVLYSLFAIGAAGSDAANKVATSEALRRSFSGRNKLECLSSKFIMLIHSQHFIFFSTYEWAQKAIVFDPGKPFQYGLMPH